MELGSVTCHPGWEGGLANTRICMAEALHCSPETITTLLIGFAPVQNVFGVKNKNKIKKKKVINIL